MAVADGQLLEVSNVARDVMGHLGHWDLFAAINLKLEALTAARPAGGSDGAEQTGLPSHPTDAEVVTWIRSVALARTRRSSLGGPLTVDLLYIHAGWESGFPSIWSSPHAHTLGETIQDALPWAMAAEQGLHAPPALPGRSPFTPEEDDFMRHIAAGRISKILFGFGAGALNRFTPSILAPFGAQVADRAITQSTRQMASDLATISLQAMAHKYDLRKAGPTMPQRYSTVFPAKRHADARSAGAC